VIAVGAVVGPTAAGKSEVAVEVAERLNGAIVSVDSMQIYRSMDAGTAKPGRHLTERVPHHLLDVFDPSHPLSVAEYQRLGRAAIERVAASGRLPLLVGGSGLYFRAIVDDLVFPPRSPDVRARLDQEAKRLGARALHARLTQADPEAAAKIEPTNVRRTVRALEVIEITGRPFSESARTWSTYASRYRIAVAGLAWSRSALFTRIAERVDRMIEAGLIEEAHVLSERDMSVTARQALGYRQVLEAPAGASVEDVKQSILRATKRFARRQESWFRADPRVVWFDAGSEAVVDDVTRYLAGALRSIPGRAPS
jgi:tRNA dimethylallyltransferase